MYRGQHVDDFRIDRGRLVWIAHPAPSVIQRNAIEIGESVAIRRVCIGPEPRRFRLILKDEIQIAFSSTATPSRYADGVSEMSRIAQSRAIAFDQSCAKPPYGPDAAVPGECPNSD